MIARILYRKSVHGVLKYVLDKPHASVLGMVNIPKQILPYPKLLKHHFHFLGSRHESDKRYVHITLNLPHGEFLDDSKFCKLAEVYMQEMGYGAQPFVIVRHDDTKHEHVHIITTRVKESGTLIPCSNDFTRNRAVQNSLENLFGLTPSPEGKVHKNLPIIRVPELRQVPDDSCGVRFYMQDVLNTLCQKYHPRSFNDLSELIRPYRMQLKTTGILGGRIGVSFGIEEVHGLKSRLIHGSKVHPDLSGPKLERLFQRNANSKLLPMHRQRIKKQLTTVFKLFERIALDDLESILKDSLNMETSIEFEAQGGDISFGIYDKSGYLFHIEEFGDRIWRELKTFQDTTESILKVDGRQFHLEYQKCVEEILLTRLAKYHTGLLCSNVIQRQTFSSLRFDLIQHPKYNFWCKYYKGKETELTKLLQSKYTTIQKELFQKHTKREGRLLESKTVLLSQVMRSRLFGSALSEMSLNQLVYSLGLDFDKGFIRHNATRPNQNILDLEAFPTMKHGSNHASGFVREQGKVLRLLSRQEKTKESLHAISYFLPLIFDELYAKLSEDNRIRQECFSLHAYWKAIERKQRSFEKSPEDYLTFLNHQGFYIEESGKGIWLKAIYGNKRSKVPIDRKIGMYLDSIPDRERAFQNQKNIIDMLRYNGRDTLNHLWAGYLIQNGCYDKAAFLIVHEGVRPNLAPDIMGYHMKTGLNEAISKQAQFKMAALQRQALLASSFVVTAFLGNHEGKNDIVFNPFKDELTDYSKYRKQSL